MPEFQCPHCRKLHIIPLGDCEWMLEDTPFVQADGRDDFVFESSCLECMRQVSFVRGDLLAQPVEVIVNPWNRNLIPWWLLIPQGVSGAIKKRGGIRPFRELSNRGMIPLGGAALTSAGRLPFKAIIHVAGINLLWKASEESIRDSARNAIALAVENRFRSIAFPLIGAGSGGFKPERSQEILLDECTKMKAPIEIRIVLFERN